MPTRLRRAEVLGILAFATDLGLGQDLGQALTGAVVASRLATSLGLTDDEASCAYDCAILNLAGCTADPRTFARYFGDELEAARRLAPVDFSDPREAVPALVRFVGASEGLLTRARLLAGLFTVGQAQLNQGTKAHCEVAGLLVPRMGCGDNVRRAVLQAFERWDGKGQPNAVAGKDLSVSGHVAQLAIEAAVHMSRGGPEAAVGMARRRSKKAFDPALVDHFARHAGSVLEGLPAPDVWTLAMGEEPGPRPTLAREALDEALRALGDFADLKSTYLIGHSAAVAELADAAAKALGLPDRDVHLVRRAAWLHDLGRVGVPVSVWDKSEAPVPRGDREGAPAPLPHPADRRPLPSPGRGGRAPRAPRRVRLSPRLHRDSALNGCAHPRRGRHVPDADVGPSARAAYSVDEVAAHLRREARAGRLDADAVEAVLGDHRRTP